MFQTLTLVGTDIKMVENNLMDNFLAGYSLILESSDKLMYLRCERVSSRTFLLNNVAYLQYICLEKMQELLESA